jgi:hypothetical protein
MVRGQKQRRILSQSEVASLEDEKQELEEQLRQTEYGAGTPAAQIDKTVIQRQIDRVNTAIAEGAAPKVRGIDKDKLAKEEKELEEQLADGMPTRYEMDHPAKCPGAVRKHINWEARNRERIERYRYVQAVLHPEAPKSIEQLRKDK